VVTAAVAVLVEKKVPTRGECGALIMLTMGVTVTVFEGKATGSGAGLMLCVAGESTAWRSSSKLLPLFKMKWLNGSKISTLLF
jgi:hypothetical protein